jgi:hypothetical protein
VRDDLDQEGASDWTLEVPDAMAARQELLDRGVDVSELTVISDADGGTFFGFQDPDGNAWAVQEIKARELASHSSRRSTSVSANGLAVEWITLSSRACQR